LYSDNEWVTFEVYHLPAAKPKTGKYAEIVPIPNGG
jgi:hypothetical protein